MILSEFMFLKMDLWDLQHASKQCIVELYFQDVSHVTLTIFMCMKYWLISLEVQVAAGLG